jgi:hypothetical protein
MMCCGQVPPLGVLTDFANSLTRLGNGSRTIRYQPFPLFTACGLRFPHVDGLCPNRARSRAWIRTDRRQIFVP